MRKYIIFLTFISILFGCKKENTNKLNSINNNNKELTERKKLNELAERTSQLISEEKYSLAIPLITEYISIQKKANKEIYTSFSYYQRGQCKYYLGDYYGSLEDLKRAETISELEPAGINPNYYVYIAKANLKLENFNEACKYLRLSGESGNSGAYELIDQYCN